MIDFSEETWHLRVCSWVIFLILHLLLELIFGFLFSLAKCELKEIVCPSLFCRLLLEDVLEKVLVPLDKPLGINLSVLDLLFSISLDAFE